MSFKCSKKSSFQMDDSISDEQLMNYLIDSSFDCCQKNNVELSEKLSQNSNLSSQNSNCSSQESDFELISFETEEDILNFLRKKRHVTKAKYKRNHTFVTSSGEIFSSEMCHCHKEPGKNLNDVIDIEDDEIIDEFISNYKEPSCH